MSPKLEPLPKEAFVGCQNCGKWFYTELSKKRVCPHCQYEQKKRVYTFTPMTEDSRNMVGWVTSCFVQEVIFNPMFNSISDKIEEIRLRFTIFNKDYDVLLDIKRVLYFESGANDDPPDSDPSD